MLGVIHVPNEKSPPIILPIPNGSSSYLGFGNGFKSTEVINLPKCAKEYRGSKESAKIRFIIWSAILNPIRRITNVIMIVIFTFFIKELKSVTKLLKAIMYNIANAKECLKTYAI